MNISDLEKKILRKIEEECNLLAEHVLDGAPNGEVQYQKTVAKRHGLLLAEQIVKDVFKRADEDDT